MYIISDGVQGNNCTQVAFGIAEQFAQASVDGYPRVIDKSWIRNAHNLDFNTVELLIEIVDVLKLLMNVAEDGWTISGNVDDADIALAAKTVFAVHRSAAAYRNERDAIADDITVLVQAAQDRGLSVMLDDVQLYIDTTSGTFAYRVIMSMLGDNLQLMSRQCEVSGGEGFSEWFALQMKINPPVPKPVHFLIRWLRMARSTGSHLTLWSKRTVSLRR